MSEIAPIRYSSEGFFYTHARRLGERRTVCGSYSLMTADFDDEKLWADGPLCPTCARGLAGIPLGEPLNDADAIAHAHAEFHGLPSAMIYSVCAWPHCNFWEVGSFLQSSGHRPPLLPLDEIREAHGRFHSLPGALLDDEENPEVCDFDAIAQLLTNTAGTETPEDTHERFHDRPAALAGGAICDDAGCQFDSVAAFVDAHWPRPALAASDLLADAHGRFHDLPGALLRDCGLATCTFWEIGLYLSPYADL